MSCLARMQEHPSLVVHAVGESVKGWSSASTKCISISRLLRVFSTVQPSAMAVLISWQVFPGFQDIAPNAPHGQETIA